MAIAIGKTRSRFIAFVAVFTALVTVFDVVPIIPGFYSGIWDSWLFLLSPIIGILLGPGASVFSVGFGTLIGHFIYFRDPFEFIFMLGAPLGAAIAALVYQKRWRPTLLIYSGLLAGYFLTPVTWLLPLWGIWDILAGYLLVILFTIVVIQDWWPQSKHQKLLLRLLFASVIGLEADILLRVFILIPGQTYWLFYRLTPAQLQVLWLTAGFITPIKVILATVFTMTIGYSLLQILPRLGVALKTDIDEMKAE